MFRHHETRVHGILLGFWLRNEVQSVGQSSKQVIRSSILDMYVN